jgi:hypothetical protein
MMEIKTQKIFYNPPQPPSLDDIAKIKEKESE